MTCIYPSLDDWGGNKPGEVNENSSDLAEELAWSMMLSLTAGRVTVCPITVRPLCATCQRRTWLSAPVWGTAFWGEVGDILPLDYFVISHAIGGCADGHARAVHLERPVGQIVEVKVDGTVVDPSAYRRDDNMLIRQDGTLWPVTQNFDVDDTQVGSFSVTYYRGYKPTALFLWATGLLAWEFYKYLSGDKKCRLPDNVTQVTRQGVSMTLEAGAFTDGRTGIREIDAVIRKYNPNALNQATVVTSVDAMRRTPRIQH